MAGVEYRRGKALHVSQHTPVLDLQPVQVGLVDVDRVEAVNEGRKVVRQQDLPVADRVDTGQSTFGSALVEIDHLHSPGQPVVDSQC